MRRLQVQTDVQQFGRAACVPLTDSVLDILNHHFSAYVDREQTTEPLGLTFVKHLCFIEKSLRNIRCSQHCFCPKTPSDIYICIYGI